MDSMALRAGMRTSVPVARETLAFLAPGRALTTGKTCTSHAGQSARPTHTRNTSRASSSAIGVSSVALNLTATHQSINSSPVLHLTVSSSATHLESLSARQARLQSTLSSQPYPCTFSSAPFQKCRGIPSATRFLGGSRPHGSAGTYLSGTSLSRHLPQQAPPSAGTSLSGLVATDRAQQRFFSVANGTGRNSGKLAGKAAASARGTSVETEAVAPATTAVPSSKDGWEAESPDWEVKMLYDGECPLCMREVNMLRERSSTQGGKIAFVDIAAPDYRPEDHSDISFEDAMGRIHAIRRDGKILLNIEAFRAFYEAVGLGWVYAVTKWEPLGRLADVVYDVWAKYRLPITGRPPMAEVLELRRRQQEALKKAFSEEDTEGGQGRCRT